MIRAYRRELSVALAYAILLLIVAALAPGFFRPEPLRDLAIRNVPVLVAAVGMTSVILCRQIDISIGSQFSICGVVAGLLAERGVPMPLVALVALATGAGFGAINGLFVAGMGLPSIVVTLATLVIGRESLRYSREGRFVQGLPSGFQWFGMGQAAGQWVVVGDRARGLRGGGVGASGAVGREGHPCDGVRSRGRRGWRASGRSGWSSPSSWRWGR